MNMDDIFDTFLPIFSKANELFLDHYDRNSMVCFLEIPKVRAKLGDDQAVTYGSIIYATNLLNQVCHHHASKIFPLVVGNLKEEVKREEMWSKISRELFEERLRSNSQFSAYGEVRRTQGEKTRRLLEAMGVYKQTLREDVEKFLLFPAIDGILSLSGRWVCPSLPATVVIYNTSRQIEEVSWNRESEIETWETHLAEFEAAVSWVLKRTSLLLSKLFYPGWDQFFDGDQFKFYLQCEHDRINREIRLEYPSQTSRVSFR